jgi:hypothetical protein
MAAACGASEGGAPTAPMAQPVRVAPGQAVGAPAPGQPVPAPHATTAPANPRPASGAGSDAAGGPAQRGMPQCPVGGNPPLHRLCPVGPVRDGGPAAP